MKYVKVVIDNKSDYTDTFYTYGCKFENIEVGKKVTVPFGKSNKEKDAYVFHVMDQIDEQFENLKYVSSIDEDVYLTKEQIDTCIWMRKRYFCRYIECVKLFLPTGKKPKIRKVTEVINDFEGEKQDIKVLTPEQSLALAKINGAIEAEQKKIFLVEGVTGSGKTEIYMGAAKKCLDKGKNVIVLVPEVSLTKQITDRFIGRFGRDKVAILHSKLSQSERYDQWQKIRNGGSRIIIGARLAVFSPLQNIGLIVLDEEHEPTYKSDMTPKYDTIEVAIKRARAYNGIVILGSATPSVVSNYRAEKGIYDKIRLKNRYNNVMLPEVFIEDMREELKEGNRSVFSKRLYDEITNVLSEKKQVILMINKRGYSSFVSCRSCGYVIKCDKCDIAMTYHKGDDKMTCHYCGKSTAIPDVCPKCGSKYIKHFGAGTEKVLEETQKLFPNAVCAKVDFDTGKKKGEINKILTAFGKGKIDILVGTQLIGKGIDYKNVDLVGIMAAEATLNVPDYRSSERTFQMITQAAGRTGRGDKRGKVIVQTYQPDNFAIISGANQDNKAFYDREILIRQLLNYPPFGTFAQVSILGKNKDDVRNIASLWRRKIRKIFGNSVFIGEKAIDGDKNFRITFLIKFEDEKKKLFISMAEKVKEQLRESKTKVSSIIDINPYSTWRN